jgi:hypothetical protein
LYATEEPPLLCDQNKKLLGPSTKRIVDLGAPHTVAL